MITCHVKYTVDPYKLAEFERYAKLWIGLIARFGGTSHGYFLPAEGANNVALWLFSFPSLAAYEVYRSAIVEDPECQAARAHAQETRCFSTTERTFFRPLLE